MNVPELMDFVRVGDTDDEFQMGSAISAASRSVDGACGRQFGLVEAAETRYFPADWDRSRNAWVVTIDDLMENPTEVGVGGTSTTAYTLLDRNAPAKGRPWTRLRLTSNAPHPGDDEVAVTARWGWTTIPPTIVQATLMQASRFLARRDSPYGVTGSADQGGELRLLAKVDPDVETMLRPYRRWWGAV